MPEQVTTPVDQKVQQVDTTVAPTPPDKRSSKAPTILLIILILVALGTGAFYLLKQPATTDEPVAMLATPAPAALTLTLTSPVEGELAVDDETLVKGMTLPNTTVVVYTETDEVTLESDAAGNFETTVTLTEGINTLVVTAFSEDGQEISKNLSIVYDSSS